jgi:hypothetical protein
MSVETLPVVNFGKYKDRPLTDLLKDNNYVEWLKTQSWFKEKYSNIYNITVNQVITTNNQNSKTPEHNRLQNLFLDKTIQKNLVSRYRNFNAFVNKLTLMFNDEEFIKCFGKLQVPKIEVSLKDTRFCFEGKYNWDLILNHYQTTDITFASILENELIEQENFYKKQEELIKKDIILIDEQINLRIKIDEENVTSYKLDEKLQDKFGYIFLRSEWELGRCKKDLENKLINMRKHDYYNDCRRQHYDKLLRNYSFEYSSTIVKNTNGEYKVTIRDSLDTTSFCCEIKPILSDDYPCVLRKLTNQIQITETSNKSKYDNTFQNMRYVLIIENFTSTYTTKEQLIEIFKQSKIDVVFIDELVTSAILEKNKYINQTENNKLLEDLVKANEIIQQLKNKIKELEDSNNI